MAYIKFCSECGNRIKGAGPRTEVCRGYYIYDFDKKIGAYKKTHVRSECDKKRRRRWKRENKEHYRIGGKYKSLHFGYRNKQRQNRELIVKCICLRCNKEFDAESVYNRICDKCVRSNYGVSDRSFRVTIAKGVTI